VIKVLKDNLEQTIDYIVNSLGCEPTVSIKKFYIGKENLIESAAIYITSLVDKEIIDRDLLPTLMFNADEASIPQSNSAEFICRRYITISNTSVEKDINIVIENIKSGRTALLISEFEDFITVDTSGGKYREITDPQNESTTKGPREGFVESLDINIGMLRRITLDSKLKVETYIVGRRSQTKVAIIYIDDIVDKAVLDEIKKRINSVDVDSITGTAMLEQFIEDSPYALFPQSFSTERPDAVKADIMEGKVGILVDGGSYAITLPSVFVQFFQGVEDYYHRTLVSSFIRIIRILSVFMVIFTTATYLTLIRYNVELIPIKFVAAISESREGIALSPLLEILLMEIVIEFLREGGLRLPPKIAGTLSVVGGIIIGNAALEAKIVSPSTLLIVGVSTIATFLVPNYEMSLSIRLIRFPMLFLADALGIFGIVTGCFIIMMHLLSLESYGVPYLTIKSGDLKDIFIRAPLWQMDNRPEAIPNNNPIRQGTTQDKSSEEKNE
jgi:spore germination protein KA